MVGAEETYEARCRKCHAVMGLKNENSRCYPTSLLDYPGHISTILFTQGCNFKCPYCHNSQLITFISDTENLLEQAKELIENRKNLIEAVVITGGEPLVQDFNELVDLIKWIKKQGLKLN